MLKVKGAKHWLRFKEIILTMHAPPYLLLTTTLLGRHYYYPHLPDKETEAQRD